MLRFTWLVLWTALLASSARAAGPLTVSPDARELLGPDGNPVFLNAATPWHILARLDRSESTQYLDARQSMGFNALLLSILVDDDFRTGSFDNAYGEPPFRVTNDFSTPNEAYFAHVDWFLQECQRRGLYVLLAPAYIGYDCNIEGFCQAMRSNGTEKMRDYGRWLGQRYGQFENIIWVNAGDADASVAGAMDVVDAVAEGIREVSPNQIHTAHCKRMLSAADCYDRPWLDLNNTYADCTGSPRKLRDDWMRAPTRPFLYLEGFYEGEHDTSPTCLRSQAYWALLGGAMGHCFGNRPMWDFWNGWQAALESTGSFSMRHFQALLKSRDQAQLVPDWNHEVLTAGYGSLDDGSYAACARAADGHTVIVYTPERRSLTVDMTRISGSEAQIWWYDPSDGTTMFAGSVPTAGTREYTPPFAGDWVLVLDDASLELPAPGEGFGVPRVTTGIIKARYVP